MSFEYQPSSESLHISVKYERSEADGLAEVQNRDFIYIWDVPGAKKIWVYVVNLVIYDSG